MTAGLLKEVELAEQAVKVKTERLHAWLTQMEETALAPDDAADAVAMIDEFQARKYEVLAAHGVLQKRRRQERALREQAGTGGAVRAAGN